MARLDRSVIRTSVSSSAFAAAEAYMRAGRVRALNFDAESDRLTAVVQGSARAPYRQDIQLLERKGVVDHVAGSCTCPVGFNCKHVAAALLAYVQQATPTRAAALVNQQRSLFAREAEASVLPPDIAAWLRGLESDAAADSDDYPDAVTKRLFYLLGPLLPHGRAAPALGVTLAASDVKQDGSLGKTYSSPHAGQLLLADLAPKYVRPADRAILRHLNGALLDGSSGDAPRVLERMIETGRARVGSYPGVPARMGEAREGAVEWHMLADGTQRPVLIVDAGGAPVLLPAPWYLDAATGEVGPIAIDMPPLVLTRMLNAPPVRPEQAAAVAAALGRALPQRALPPPRELPRGGKLDGKPTPHLSLRKLTTGYYPDTTAACGGAMMALSFRYGPALIARNQTATELVVDGTLYTLVRNQSAERRAEVMLTKLNFVRARQRHHYGVTSTDLDNLVPGSGPPEAQWLNFMIDDLPTLRAAGWDIEVAEDFPYRLIEPTGAFDAELHEGSGIDWFDLDLGVLVGEERIDLVPPLLSILASPHALQIMDGLRDAEAGRKMVLQLQDGRRLVLEAARIGPVLLTLFELFAAGGISMQNGRIGMSRAGAADVARLEQAGLAAGLVWRGGEAIRALGRQLRERGGIPEVAVPAWFQAELRPYQARGVDWLQFLRQAGLAGVLADDMGLGKTVQTLAHLAVEKAAGRLTAPALVICPTSVVGNWAREAARFVPDFRVLALQGSDRKVRFADIANSDLVISTYPLLARDADVLTAQEWHALILDEAQTVKNPAASMAVTVRQIRAAQRICLTGTPMENHLGELWALFDFMMPGFLGTKQEFGRRFRTPIEKGGDAALHAALAKRVSPFLLRRNKAEVATDLPPRTDIVETVQMGTAQRGIYEGIRMAMHARVQQAIAEHGLAKSGIVILDALLKMRQACCDPRLLKIAASRRQKAGSAKLERLLELLETMLDEGRSILLFSQFTSMLDLIAEQLKAAGIPYVTLTGQTKDRKTPVDAFQAGRVKLFLISLKAGGVGLNLTAADTVIHYDPWWNPAAENQATDRAHRIGQTKKVFVHRLMTENSIEEKMEVLKARKSALAEGILSGAGARALRMTEGDVEMLFG